MRELVACLFAKENSLMIYGKLVILGKDSGLPEPCPGMRGCEIWGASGGADLSELRQLISRNRREDRVPGPHVGEGCQ